MLCWGPLPFPKVTPTSSHPGGRPLIGQWARPGSLRKPREPQARPPREAVDIKAGAELQWVGGPLQWDVQPAARG